MHERERWQVVKAMLKERTLVRIAEACRATGASEASVRRDFARLAEQGLAVRVHGGLEAIPDASSAPGDVLSLATRAFDVSQTLNIQAKRAIAKAAVALCADGDTNERPLLEHRPYYLPALALVHAASLPVPRS